MASRGTVVVAIILYRRAFGIVGAETCVCVCVYAKGMEMIGEIVPGPLSPRNIRYRNGGVVGWGGDGVTEESFGSFALCLPRGDILLTRPKRRGAASPARY